MWTAVKARHYYLRQDFEELKEEQAEKCLSSIKEKVEAGEDYLTSY